MLTSKFNQVFLPVAVGMNSHAHGNPFVTLFQSQNSLIINDLFAMATSTPVIPGLWLWHSQLSNSHKHDEIPNKRFNSQRVIILTPSVIFKLLIAVNKLGQTL